jgi:hypothetical protein
MWMFNHRSRHKFDCNKYAERIIYVKLFSSKCYCCVGIPSVNRVKLLMVSDQWSVWNSFEYINLNFELMCMNPSYLAAKQHWIIGFVTFDSVINFMLTLEPQVCPLVPHSNVLPYIIFATCITYKILKVINGHCLPNPDWYPWNSVSSWTKRL